MPKLKYCPSCKSDKIIKKRCRNGVQKYQCKSCKKWSQSKRQATQIDSVWHKNWIAVPITYQDYLNQNNPNQTNQIDCGVNTKLKELNRLHRGMRVDRRNKLLVKLLYNLKGI